MPTVILFPENGGNPGLIDNEPFGYWGSEIMNNIFYSWPGRFSSSVIFNPFAFIDRWVWF